MALSDEDECKMAASELSIDWYDSGYWSKNPKGCFIISSFNSAVWNSHQTGSNRPDSKAICRSDGKNTATQYFPCHQMLIGYLQLEHQWIIESTYILDLYVATQNTYCDDHDISMTSAGLDEAKRECLNDPKCSRFYYDCSAKKYYKCLASNGQSSSGCGSIVYTKGNHHL